MKKIFLYIILITVATSFAEAQDIHFSQYNYSPLNYSPATTGLFDGDIRANGFYRNQWNSVTIPYKTFGLAYDQVLGIPSASGARHSAGALINSDRAGDGNFGTLQLLLSYAHLFSINSDSIHFISAGVQAGFNYRSLDFNRLTFDNQFTGDVFNPSAPTNESFDRTSYIYPDLNAGISWLGNFDNTTVQAGFSVQHLIKPNQTFLNESNGLPMRFQMNAGAWFLKNEKISFYPSVIYMMQSEFRELTGGAEVKFNLQKESVRKRALSLGAHYRSEDAIIPSVAVYYDLWRIGLSYDVNTSDLDAVSRKRGGPEFNVTYIMKKIRYIKPKNICPVY